MVADRPYRGIPCLEGLRDARLSGHLHLGRGIQQPPHAFQKATQYFTIGGPHIQRQRDDVIDRS
jgi:hypothetical protein